jgi:hypothetical protein
MGGVTVTVRGAGIVRSGVTDATGTVRLRVRPRQVGIVQIQLGSRGTCGATTKLVEALAPFRPPKPNYTG